MTTKRKLIEVALPLEAINRESAREKSIRHGHPSTLHLWWARRPLAAARAVLFAQLVDDPSNGLSENPTVGERLAERKERDRLHEIIEALVVWENVNPDKHGIPLPLNHAAGIAKNATVSGRELLQLAHAEIRKSAPRKPGREGVPEAALTDDDVELPAILDPFAGGGTIPLEAQRLGLEAHASDLNPVAVLINKALIEIPPKFADQPPVNPDADRDRVQGWHRAQGLAEDVRLYGQWMRDETEKRIGNLYPKATLPDGTEANVIAWIWARTVTCPNPACGIQMPLVRSWWLGKKKGKEAYVVPHVVNDPEAPSGRRIEFTIGHDKAHAPTAANDGTMSGRQGGHCIACQTAVAKDYIKSEGSAGRMGAQLMAVVAEGNRRRVYLPPTSEQIAAAAVERPIDIPNGQLPDDPRNFWTPAYGLTQFSDLFTNRQLVALTTFSDLVGEAREKVLADATAAGLRNPAKYADAVATYLGMAVSRTTDLNNSLVTWSSSRDQARNLFARQAIPMAWDFVEVSPFGNAAGDVAITTETQSKALAAMSSINSVGTASQADAATRVYRNLVVSTDPPYYDNIGYSDLSDFFYVWLRRSLRSVHPQLFSTMLVPKAEELVANPYRQGSKDNAKDFFENGFREVFAHARESAGVDYPITVYYAFKQSDSDEGGEASTGWETLLEGMIRSGWEITSTWPMRSERGGRMLSVGTNALASSIVLSLRPREQGAPTTDRRGFIAALEAELPDALRKLQQGQIAPVDLPQAAIGPGMAVFSRYSAVLEPDGSKMSVRSALARINEILDQVLNEQEGDFDTTSRFAISWYRQHGYSTGDFGDADNLARARNTNVDKLARDGVLISSAGKVTLRAPSDLDPSYDVVSDPNTSAWEALHHLIRLLEAEGIGAAGQFLAASQTRTDSAVDPDMVKELAHLLYRIAEGEGRTKDALAFNTLVTTWLEIVEASRYPSMLDSQGSFVFDEE